MGKQETPGGPPKVPSAPIRLKSTDPADPPDQLDNAVPIEEDPVTDPPDALPSDETMSLEIDVAAEPEAREQEPEIVMVSRTHLEHATPQEKLDAAAAAAEESRVISEEKAQARAERRQGTDLRVVDEWASCDDVHDLETLEGQIRLIQENLQRFVDVSGAPYLGDDCGTNIQRIVQSAPSKLEGRDLAVITRVLLGTIEPNWELLGYSLDQYMKAQKFANLQVDVELKLLAKEVNQPRDEPDHRQDQLSGAFLPEAEDLEEIIPPTAEKMRAYWDLVPEIKCPEGEVVFSEYAVAMDAIAAELPATHLDEDPRAEAVADLALALTGIKIPLRIFESSARILRGESPEETRSMGARFPVVDTPHEPLLSPEERVALDDAVSGLSDPLEWETEDVSPPPVVRTPDIRRRIPTMGKRGRQPIPGAAAATPAVRKVRREQLVPASALWSLAALVVVLACVVTAVLLREDTIDRQASQLRDTAQDLKDVELEEKYTKLDTKVDGVIADFTSQKTEVVSLTRERDGFQSLADESKKEVVGLRTEVGNLDRATRLRIGVLDEKIRLMQRGQSRERDFKDRIEATETMATTMVKTQECPSVGTGSLTSGQSGTIFQCVQSGAKAFIICIGADSTSAHSCQMTTAPK